MKGFGRKLLAWVVLWLHLCTPAFADLHYYMATTGYDGNPGTEGAPWRTMAQANKAVDGMLQANTDNGHVWLHIAAGDYDPGSFPNPPHPALDGKRYMYVGANLADPGLVLLPACTITKPYVTIKGVAFQGDMGFSNTCRDDSLLNFHISGSHSWGSADYCVVADGTIDGKFFTTGFLPGGSCISTKMLRCVLNLSHNEYPVTIGRVENKPDLGIQDEVRADSLMFWGNRFNLRITGYTSSNRVMARMHYLNRWCTFRDNYWDIICDVNDGLEPGFVPIYQRDSTIANRWVRDTVVVRGQAEWDDWVMTVSTGNTGPNGEPYGTPRFLSVGDNTYDSCFIQTPTAIAWSDGARKDTVRSNVILCDALDFYEVTKGVVVEHNTIASLKTHSRYARGMVTFNDGEFQADSTKFYSNIVYGFAAGTRNPTVSTYQCIPPREGCQDGSTLGGLFIGNVGQGLFKHGWNLYGVFPYADTPGDRSIITCCYPHVIPSGTSKWGSPRFGQGGPDSMYFSFDPRLGAGSLADNMGMDGTDAGAISLAGYPSLSVISTVPIEMAANYGVVSTATFTIKNIGDATLDMTAITSNTTELTVPAALDISPASTQSFMVSYSPSSPNPTTQPIITIYSNDPSQPIVTITVHLTGSDIESQD